MQITKLGHACVRIEHEGQVVVIDPGVFTEPDAAAGATAVLVTHEHADHWDAAHLRATDAPVWTIGAVAEQLADQAPDVLERTTVVAPGESFDVGLPVTAVGAQHAILHSSLPTYANSGFLLTAGEQRLFHPGDSFEVPEEPVDVFFLPVSGPWTKLAEVLDHAAAVAAPLSVAVHDRVLSDVGLAMLDERVAAYLEGTGEYRRVPDGSEV